MRPPSPAGSVFMELSASILILETTDGWAELEEVRATLRKLRCS